MKKILAALLAVSLLLGCGAKEGGQEAEWYAFEDDLGSRVSLSAPPETVAVLFSSYADIWLTAGGSVDITVGESVERGFAEAEAVLVDAGSGHSSIDLERLINARPDLVIATADYACQVEAVEICSENGIPAAAFRVESFDDYLRVLEICTRITGRSDIYESCGVGVGERIDAMLDSLPEGGEKSILFLRAGSTDKSTKAKTAEENFVCAMLEELGTSNIADAAPVLLDSLSLEEIIMAEPEYIFISTMGNEEAAKAHIRDMFASGGWSSLEAVRKGNYCFLEKELFHFKPNARWDEAYGILIDLLYPEN